MLEGIDDRPGDDVMNMDEGLERVTMKRKCFLVVVEPPIEQFPRVMEDVQLYFLC